MSSTIKRNNQQLTIFFLGWVVANGKENVWEERGAKENDPFWICISQRKAKNLPTIKIIILFTPYQILLSYGSNLVKFYYHMIVEFDATKLHIVNCTICSLVCWQCCTKVVCQSQCTAGQEYWSTESFCQESTLVLSWKF